MRLTASADTKKVLKDLESYEKKVRDSVVDAINETALAVETGAKRRAPVNVERLRSSIATSLAKPENNPLGEVEVNARYAPYVEFGTKSRARIPAGLEGYAAKFKGGGGTFDELLANIRRWAKHKGIEEFAFPIAVRIAREGVDPQPFLFPAVEEERPRFIKRLRKAINDID